MSAFFDLSELENGLDEIRMSPNNDGIISLIVRRPEINEREELSTAELNCTEGLAGDNWQRKPSSSMPNGEPHPAKQLTLMNSRAIQRIAGSKDRWKLAGDQLFVDFNLSYSNIPPGTRLMVGEAVIEVSEPPHRGCKKFSDRFGADAMRFVNSEAGRELNLRGINAVVVKEGLVRIGDVVKKLQN